MKKIILLLCVVASVVVLPGCKKFVESLIPPIPNDSTTTEPTITDVGTPVGDLVSKIIGKDGGSIVSADGTAELIFPAGALNDNTNISVQAVTQTAPNGVGYGYQFLPEGIKFSKAVTLKIHYTAADLAATLGDLMGVAFQDNLGGWWRLSDFTNDTANKIISAPIKHFTAYTAFDMLLISPPVAAAQVGTSLSLQVIVIESDDDELADLGKDETVAPLIKTHSKTVSWSVNGIANGNANVGTVSGNSLSASFTAPAKVPSQNPVAVSALIDTKFKYKGKNVDKPTLTSNVRIVDQEIYLVEMRLLDTVIHTDVDMIVVWDSVSMKVTVKGTTVTVSDITNFASKADPSQIVYPDDATYFVPDPVGEINIISATGKISPNTYFNAPDDRLLGLTFVQSGTHDPKTHYFGPNGYSDFSGGDPNPGYPMGWGFELLPDGEPTTDPNAFNGLLAKVMDVTITLQK